jgi:predicted RNA-binding protein with TRAM domain
MFSARLYNKPAFFLLHMSYSGRGNYGGGGGRGGGYGGGLSRGGFGGPKPVEVGKEYEVQISELSRQGDGIARIQGFVIFVKGAKAGEKARIKVTKVGDRSANGEVVENSAQSQEAATTASSSSAAAAVTENAVAPKEVAQTKTEEKVDLRDFKTAGRQKDLP